MAKFIEGDVLAVVEREFENKETGEVSKYCQVQILVEGKVSSKNGDVQSSFDLFKLSTNSVQAFKSVVGKKIVVEFDSFVDRKTGLERYTMPEHATPRLVESFRPSSVEKKPIVSAAAAQ